MHPVLIVAVALIGSSCLIVGFLTLAAKPLDYDPGLDTSLTAEDLAWLSLDVRASWSASLDEQAARSVLRPRTGHVQVQPQTCRFCRDTGFVGEGFARCNHCTVAWR